MKKLLCVLTAVLFLLGCAAYAESAETPEPFTIRDTIRWEMAPDEVAALESVTLSETSLVSSDSLYCLVTDEVRMNGHDASLYYIFTDRALSSAMFNITDDAAYYDLQTAFEGVYGEGAVLPEGTAEDWTESLNGYRPEVTADEYGWTAPDGTSIWLVQFNGGTAVILNRPEYDASLTAAQEKPAWTILIYLCGADLESVYGNASANMTSMLNAADSADVQIVLETGGSTAWQNGIDPEVLRRFVRRDGSFKYVEDVGLADMTQPSTLQDFVSWGLRNYPAERTGLIIWDHGGSSVDGVCVDEIFNTGASLTLPGLASALAGTSRFLPQGFEFIGFDACVMSSLECANAMVPYAKYMYASEESEPGSGWDYQTLLDWLAENPQADGWDLGQEQVISYSAFQSSTPSQTMGVIDLAKIPAVCEAFEQAAEEFDTCGKDAEVIRLILQAQSFGPNNRTSGYINMIDIEDMMRLLADYAPSYQTVIDAIEAAVVHRNNGDQHAGAGGLSIYYPIRLGGTMAIPSFQQICPSTYYLDFVSRVSKAAEVSGETLSALGTWVSVPDSTDIVPVSAEIDKDGIFHATLADMDNFAHASCVLYELYDDQDIAIYCGEDDNVTVDFDACRLTDNFDGTWTTMNRNILPLELVSKNDSISVYTVPILYAGKEMNLRLIWNWETRTYSIDGVCADVDKETGMAGRLFDLQEGDTFQICYYYKMNDEYSMITSDPITVDDTMDIEFMQLPEGYYRYNIVAYDLAGNDFVLNNVIYHVMEDGSVTIPVERNNSITFDPEFLAE